jgi:hypothetical protein
MASTIPPILIQLQADVSQLKKGLADAESAIKGVDSNVKQASTGMTNFVGTLKKVGAAMGATFAVAQITNFAKQSVMASSNMEESLSKVRVVFGEGAAEVEAFGASAAQNLGISNQAALEAAGTYGNLFQAFGLGQGEAQKMSTSLVQLAADMASFNNTSIDQAITALRSGLSGETEPLKRFGVALSEVRLKEEALRMGLIKTTSGTLPVAIKSQAAYSLILKDTALAQGDYARTADGTANTMKTLQAKIEDAKVALGEALMPAFRAVLKILELLIPVLKTIGKFFTENKDAIKVFAIYVGALTAAFYAYRAALIVTRVAQQAYVIVTTLMKGATLASIASTNGLAASMLALNAAMRANPIGLIVTALALVGVAFVMAWKKSETFRGVVIKGAQIILNGFALLVQGIGKLIGAFSRIPGMGWAKGLADGAKKAADSIRATSDGLSKLKNIAVETNKAAAAKGNPKVVDTKVEEATKEAAKKAKERAEKLLEIEMAYIEKQIEVHENYQEKVADLHKTYGEAITEAEEADRERRADAQKIYNAAVEDAQKTHTREMVDIAKDYAKKTAEIEATLQRKLTDLKQAAATKAADLRAKAAEKEVSIIQQSVDRLRSAFASGTSFSLSEAFKGKTSGGFLDQMKKELEAAKKLQQGAAYLAGEGYAQTFIEQVVKAGPEVGNQMIDELKKSSPEQQKEIRETFMSLESIQDTGLDALAKSMNNGANLATSELRQAYDQVAIDLKNSLAEVDRELMSSLAEANAEYARAMTEAKTERDARMLEAATQLQTAIAEAKARLEASLAESAAILQKAREEAQKKLNEGLAEAQKVLQKALVDAQLAYQKAIDEISASTAQKLAALKAQLAAVAAATAALASANAAYSSAASGSTSPYVSTGPFNSNGGVGNTPYGPTTNNNISITGVNLSDPYATTTSVVNAIKFGNVVVPTAPSKLAAGESGAIGAASIKARTITLKPGGGGGGGQYGTKVL